MEDSMPVHIRLIRDICGCIFIISFLSIITNRKMNDIKTYITHNMKKKEYYMVRLLECKFEKRKAVSLPQELLQVATFSQLLYQFPSSLAFFL